MEYFNEAIVTSKEADDYTSNDHPIRENQLNLGNDLHRRFYRTV